MPRIFSIVSTIILFFSPLRAQVLNEEEYEDLLNILNRISTDSADKLLDQHLSSERCTRFDSVRLFNMKGRNASNDGNHSESLDMYQKAFGLLRPEDGYLWEVKIRLHLSVTYADLRKFTQAANELFKVKAIVGKQNDSIYLHKIAEYFAHLYYSQGNTDSAFYYLGQVAAVYESWKDTTSISRIYNNLAVLYKTQGLLHKALHFNQKSLALSLDQKDELSTSQSYNNIGRCYELLYEKTDSIAYLKKALHFYEESSLLKMKLNNNWNSAIANLARLNRALGNDEVADTYYAYLELSGHKNKSKEMLDVYREQMLHSINNNQIADAAHYFVLYDSVLKDLQQLQEEDFKQMLANQRKLYHARKVEQEQRIQLQNEQNKRLKIEKKQITTQTVFVIFIIIVLGLFYYLRQRNSYLALKAERETKQLQDAVLRTQMNPHFIFNALTAIQNSILKEDQLVTASYVSRFARLIRQTFDFANVEKVSLEEDLSALTDYIETQKMRFNDRFSFHINIDPKIKPAELRVPPMMLQPLVENAIHHGFKQLSKKGEIQIKITQSETGKICFEVTDNGVGYRPQKKNDKQHALDVLKNRLALFNEGDEASFDISGLTGGGTKVYYELTINGHV